jgi:uncharacterized membrane protein
MPKRPDVTQTSLTPEQRTLRAQVAANTRWARPGERQRHGDKISEARLRHHEARVDPEGVLEPAERRKLAQNSLRAEMARLALRSSRARKRGGDDRAA